MTLVKSIEHGERFPDQGGKVLSSLFSKFPGTVSETSCVFWKECLIFLVPMSWLDLSPEKVHQSPTKKQNKF